MIGSYALLWIAALGLASHIRILLQEPEGQRDQTLMVYGFIAPVFYGATGFFMLRGANWARVLYFPGVILLVLALHFFVRGPTIKPHLVIAGLLSLTFLSEHANRFFLGRATVFPKRERKDRPESSRRPRERRGERAGKYDF